MSAKLRIDEELRAFIPPLSAAELEALARSLLASGRAIEPLTVWNGTIVDGHNRFALCSKHGLPFDTVEVQFADRAAAKRWMLERQLARRNLSCDQIIALAVLRGVPVPDACNRPKSLAAAAEMFRSEAGKSLLERVLSGEIQTLVRAQREVNAASGVAGRGRRSRVEIALQYVLRLSPKDLELFNAKYLSVLEAVDGA